jgi:D-sedoheptulose 7-phosphate isomerase
MGRTGAGPEKLRRWVIEMTPFPEAYLARLRVALETIDLDKVGQAIEWFREVRAQGRSIFVCGNGGSAAAASHLVTDVLKSASYGRASRFRILALTDSVSTITAYANSIGCRTMALTGRNGGRLGPLAQLNLQAGEQHMGRIEEVHLTICHMIGYYFIDGEA